MNSVVKVAIVTGAGSGIGKEASKALASAGFAVVLAGRRADRLADVASEVRKAGTNGGVLEVVTDITDAPSVKALFARVRAEFGRLDLLFNNAGVFVPGAMLDELSIDHWNTVIATNLTGAFLCTQEAFRIMKDQEPRGGRIINNGSISAHVPRPRSVAYTASKHAITGLTRSTSLDGRQYDIACGQIDVGNASTEPMERMKRGTLQANGLVAVEPTFDPAEVGRAVVYMASLPLDANVQFMTIMATKMPYIGRG